MKWNEMKWNEMKWNEMKWNESMADKPNRNPNPEPYFHGYEKDKTSLNSTVLEILLFEYFVNHGVMSYKQLLNYSKMRGREV